MTWLIRLHEGAQIIRRGVIYFLLCLSYLVWPSKHSIFNSFKKLIKKSYFKPSINTSITVDIQLSDTRKFPIRTCNLCQKLFEESGILDAVSSIQAGLLSASQYNLEEEVS